MEPDRNYHCDELIQTDNVVEVCVCVRGRVCACVCEGEGEGEPPVFRDSSEDVIQSRGGVVRVLRLCTSPR